MNWASIDRTVYFSEITHAVCPLCLLGLQFNLVTIWAALNGCAG
ncbi:MAG: hypothetical protein RIR17_1320 [Planctomycetota bacterium]|jgi:hypothetical protein